MSEQPVTTVSAPVAAAVEAVAAKTRAKFASENPTLANPWGIRNDRGEVVTTAYLRAYLQCWTRGEWGYVNQPTMTRKAIYDACLSDAWILPILAKEPNATASRLGQLCSMDPMWGKAAENARNGGTNKRKPTAAAPAAAAPAPVAETIVAQQPDAAAVEFAAAVEPAPAAPAEPAPAAPAEPAPVATDAPSMPSESARDAARKNAAGKRNR